MKKHFLKVFLTVVTTVLMFTLFVFSSSAFTTTDCIGESIEVSTFAEFKSALENYASLSNIVLKNHITVNDDANSYTVNITKNGTVAVDLNGYKLTVNSKSTKYLFNVTAQTRLYFVNGKSNRSAIIFNTTQPEAAMLRVYHTFAEIYNVNVDFTMGNLYKATTDSSDTAIFRVDRAQEMNVFGGILHNEMTNGNGIYIASDDRNKQRLNFRVGGGEIEANKYCVSFNPDFTYTESFGSVTFESLNSDQTKYERIKVPSTSSITLNDLWYTPGAGSDATIFVGSTTYSIYNHNHKITSLSKANISAVRNCDALSNKDDYVVIRCAGGHMQICGTCKLKFNRVGEHSNQREIGVSPTCTTNGKTTGEKCTECRYSTSKSIPKTGHSLTYVPGKAVECGVDGTKAHYYCSGCRGYFSDAEGKNAIAESSVIIKHNHNIENKSAISATCTKTGLTAGIYCHTCKKHILKQETIPAKGHDYPDNWTVKTYPTCEHEGTKIKACKRCGTTQTMSIEKTAHTDGDENKKCDFCGKQLTPFDEVKPEGPNYPDNPDNGDDGDNSDTPSKKCSCNCHAKGIKNFFFKIGLFFQRIFRANKYCKGCGVAHY